MFLTRLSIRQPVAVLFAVAIMVIAGISSLKKMNVDYLQEKKNIDILIQTVCIGADPGFIESEILKPIEKQLECVNSIKNVHSYAVEDNGYIILEIDQGDDYKTVMADVKEKTGEILNKLPGETVIKDYISSNEPTIRLAVVGPQHYENLKLISEDIIKPHLMEIEGVSQVSVTGGIEREIQVNLKRHRLSGLNLSIDSVANIVASQTTNVSGVHVSGSRNCTVRVRGQFEKIDQIRNITIPSSKGNVPLFTIADVIDTFEESGEWASFNSDKCIGLSVFKKAKASSIDVSDAVLNAVNKINLEFTDGTIISIISEKSKIFSDPINKFQINILLVTVLITVLTFLLYGDFWISIITSLCIIITVIMSLTGLQFINPSIDVVILFGYEISIGMIVTFSSIVFNNIKRNFRSEVSVKNAIATGISESIPSIVVPLLICTGLIISSQYIENSAFFYLKPSILVVILISFITIFLVCTLIPVIMTNILKRWNKNEDNRNIINILNSGYTNVISSLMRYRIIIALLAITSVVLTVKYLIPEHSDSCLPVIDEEVISIAVEMPSCRSNKNLKQIIDVIENRLSTISEINSIYSVSGSGQINDGRSSADMIINLKNKNEHKKSTTEIINAINSKVSDIPDAKIVVREGRIVKKSDIRVDITGNDIKEIINIADKVKSISNSIPHLTDIEILSGETLKPEIKIVPDRLLLDKYGINMSTLADNIRSSLTGKECAVLSDKRGSCSVKVQYENKDNNIAEILRNIPLVTSSGVVPVKVLAEIKHCEGQKTIMRKNGRYMVSVIANVSNGYVWKKTEELKNLTDKIELPSGYHISLSNSSQIIDLSKIHYVLAVVLIILYIALAVSLESFLHPLLIIMALPISISGSIWGLFLSGYSISIITVVVVIVTACIALCNAVLMVKHAGRRQKDGLSAKDAILEACSEESKVVAVSNLVIILALIPQALTGSSTEGVFALTAIGAITGSIIMNLFLIPVFYFGDNENKKAAIK